MQPVYDKLYEAWVVPHSCPVCRKCWLIVKAGRCVHGGPYRGYVAVPDEVGGGARARLEITATPRNDNF